MEKIYATSLNKYISKICLGTWAIGGRMWNGTDEKTAIITINQALEEDINIIDTAPVYGLGVSETIIGKAIKSSVRENIIISSKAGLNWANDKVYRDCSKNRIENEIHKSLKRLNTEYIDIYFVHWPDKKVNIEELAYTYNKFLAKGLIRAIGLSNFSVSQIAEFRKFSTVSFIQAPYNLFEKWSESTIIPYCTRHNLHFMGYSTICRGILSGKFKERPIFNGDDIRQFDPKYNELFEQYKFAVEKLEIYSQNILNRELIHLALKWVIRDGNTCAIIGARRPEQIKNINDVFGWELKDNHIQQISNIYNQFIKSPVGDEFMAPPE